MYFGLTSEQARFREEVVGFLEERVKPEWWFAETESEEYRALGRGFDQELAKRGWWTMHWPVEYGGQAKDHVTQAVLLDEESFYEIPTAGGHGRFIIGPALMKFGTEEQKRKYLPPIARAESILAIGYTEPNAGSDLAVMDLRAERKGDEYILNGQKTFITYGHFADAILLAARTDPTVPKHKGISLFMVDMHLPGIRVSPIWCTGGQRVNDVYFEDVHIPANSVLGVENRGFYHMATALNFERAGVNRVGPYRRTLALFLKLCTESYRNGRPLSEDPLVRQKLGELAADVEAWRMICWRVVWLQSKGQVPSWEASEVQLFRKDVTPKFCRGLWEITNLYGLVTADSKWAPMAGRVEKQWRKAMDIHGQGGRNVTRNVIARRGLDMPRGL